jgi:hypothetical protein
MAQTAASTPTCSMANGAWYADIVSRLGYVPLTAWLSPARPSSSLLKTVDGAGSDLDADLLDGKHAAAFVLVDDAATFGSNANGYWRRCPTA